MSDIKLVSWRHSHITQDGMPRDAYTLWSELWFNRPVLKMHAYVHLTTSNVYLGSRNGPGTWSTIQYIGAIRGFNMSLVDTTSISAFSLPEAHAKCWDHAIRFLVNRLEATRG